jgi:hypothetical protein
MILKLYVLVLLRVVRREILPTGAGKCMYTEDLTPGVRFYSLVRFWTGRPLCIAFSTRFYCYLPKHYHKIGLNPYRKSNTSSSELLKALVDSESQFHWFVRVGPRVVWIDVEHG